MDNHPQASRMGHAATPGIASSRTPSPSSVDNDGRRYARLLGAGRLPQDEASLAKAGKALARLATQGSAEAFSEVWDDLMLRVERSKQRRGAPDPIMQSFVDDSMKRRLGLMERNVAIWQDSKDLAHEMKMARLMAETTPNFDDAERAAIAAGNLAQRLMPEATRIAKGTAPRAGSTDYFEQAYKYTYRADVHGAPGPTLLREVVIPAKNNKKYLMEASTAFGGYGKVRPATGPDGELLVAKVTRLAKKVGHAVEPGKAGPTHALSLTSIKRENDLLVRAGSPLAAKDIVVVDDKVIAFQERYAGDVLDLIVDLGDHPMRQQLVLYVFEHIAQDVLRMHDAGIIHHDIKPENMLYDLVKKPTLCDYGMAHRGKTAYYVGVRGSQGHIAPEVVNGPRGTIYTQQADIFSLGASLAYMTAFNIRDLPFHGVDTSADKGSQYGMRTAVRVYEDWRARRSTDTNIDGPLDWGKISVGEEALDRQALSMRRYGEGFANVVFDMLLADPRRRPNAVAVASIARGLARDANIDMSALTAAMAEGHKRKRRGVAAETIIKGHAAVRREIAQVRAADPTAFEQYPEDNLWLPRSGSPAVPAVTGAVEQLSLSRE